MYLFIVPCAMRSSTCTHKQSMFALQQQQHIQVREEAHIIVMPSLFTSASKHISKPLQSMMHTSIEHVILCYCVVLCVCFFRLFPHTFLFVLHCLTCHSSVLYIVNELNRSSKKTEPNQIDASLYGSITAWEKKEKTTTTTTTITRWTLSACVSEELSSTRFLVTFIHISFFDIFGQAHLLFTYGSL